MDKHIYHLYARPSFWDGIARLFDFGGLLNQYNYSKSGKEADFRAIQSDWEYVGQDIYKAIEEYDNQISKKEREREIE